MEMRDNKKSEKKYGVIVVVVLILAVVGLGFGIFRKLTKKEKMDFVRTQTVNVIHLNYGTIEKEISVTGTVSPVDNSTVTAKCSGEVLEIFVKNGDKVKKGDPICVINNKRAIDAALLSYEQAKNTEEDLSNGLTTVVEYNNANLEESNSFQQMETARNDMLRLKTSIAKYLGYDLADLNKLVFVEPSINVEEIINIEYDKDFNKMLISDSNYNRTLVSGDEGSNGSTKLPGSTGSVIYNKKVQMAKMNVEINFERIFANLINKCRLYISNLTYLSKIANLKEADNKSKYQSGLISEADYIKNSIDVLRDRGNLADSKYELLKAYNEYYYSTLLY